MNNRLGYAVRILVLACYCGYAISPIYLSTAAFGGDGKTGCGHREADVTLGIVWVNVLFSQLLNVHQCVPESGPIVRTAAHDREFILIKKKRAVLRESYQVRPLQSETAEASTPGDAPAAPLPVTAAPRSAHGGHKDFPFLSYGGLSPPLPPV
jgi:hypothetical protein